MKNYSLTIALLLIATVMVGQGRLLDPAVRTGKLENGMTYYILKNDKPKERADFYIAHNVGAVLEEDHQDGLAHMLEHLAFNGSDNFKGKGIKDFLERQGVSFGGNINAYTNTDETVYTVMNVPTEKPEVLDTCILILHDWSGSLTLSEEEIEAERGVVHEEWRRGNSARRRMFQELAPTVFYQSKYAERNVIGDMDVIDNCPPSALRSFYEKWYRPELQAAIIVGDFDVDEMEVRVKRILSRIPKTQNGAEVPTFQVADNRELLYDYATDEEATRVNYSLLIKHPSFTKSEKGREYYKNSLISSFLSSIIGERLQIIEKKPGAPFLGAGISYSSLARTKDILSISASKPLDQDLMTSFKSLMVEVERVVRHGIADTELERVKKSTLKGYEQSVKNKDEVHNQRLTRGLVSYFTSGHPFLDPAAEYDLAKELIDQISAKDLQNFLIEKYTEENRVVTVMGPTEVDFEYPTKKEITQMFEELKSIKIEPFVDKTVDRPFLSQEPVPGTIVSQKKLDGTSATEYTLNNGARVLIYKTDHNPTEISFYAHSKGGTAVVATKDLPTASIAARITASSGIGEHTKDDVSKILTGKILGVSPRINNHSEALQGSSTPEDLETLLQYVYMYFEAPRFDQEVYTKSIEQLKMQLEMTADDNKRAMGDSIQVATSNAHVRRPIQTLDYVNQIQFDKIETLYKDRFSNAGDFVFFFVGAIDEQESLPLILKYIGAISDNGRREEWKDEKVRPVADGYENIFSKEMETPKQVNYISYHGAYEATMKDQLMLEIASSILSLRYFEKVREQEGGSYGVRVKPIHERVPKGYFYINISFDSNPEKAEKLVGIIHQEIKELAANGPTDEEFEKIVESKKKNREASLEENAVYLRGFINHYLYGYNTALPENYEDILNGITMDEFRQAFKKMIKKSDHFTVIMQPE